MDSEPQNGPHPEFGPDFEFVVESPLLQRERHAPRYREELQEALRSAVPAAEAFARLQPLRTALRPERVRELDLQAVRSYLDHALEDDLLSLEEEERLDAFLHMLGIDHGTFHQHLPEYVPRLLVARINDGRLPTVPREQAALLTPSSPTLKLDPAAVAAVGACITAAAQRYLGREPAR